jgi:tetratricopeptide (TPR) repeat protein
MKNHLISTIVISFLSTFLVLGSTALSSFIVISFSTMGTASGSTTLPNNASNFNVNKPASAIDLVKKGIALGHLGKYNEAISLYDKALVIKPNNTAALTNKGVALYHLGRYNEAISLYDKVSTIDPNNTAALTNKNMVITLNRTK